MGRLRRDRGAGRAAGLRESVQHWRGSRQKGRAMPEELWVEAAALAQVHGVYAVSRKVGLSYESLRRRTVTEPKLIDRILKHLAAKGIDARSPPTAPIDVAAA